MGGRGASSGLSFSIPNGGSDDAFSPFSISERTPGTVREALGDKGGAKSVSDALKNVNPYYSGDFAEYSENCQRCVVAYEMRRRGYDVEAQPTYKGDEWPRVITVNGQRMGRWRGAFRHAETVNVGSKGNNLKAENRVLDNLRNKMREFGSGSRAVVNIQYRGVRFGHVFNVENQGGRISFVDAQTGNRYDSASMKNLMRVVDTSSVGLTRTDNLRVSGRITNFVWQNHNKRNK